MAPVEEVVEVRVVLPALIVMVAEAQVEVFG